MCDLADSNLSRDRNGGFAAPWHALCVALARGTRNEERGFGRRAIFVARRPAMGRAIRGPSRRPRHLASSQGVPRRPPGRETRSRGGARGALQV